ncbi:MAG: Uma2 family endonuclease [Thermosynechococcaceae cyanobacterium]
MLTMTAITLNLEPLTQLTHEQFFKRCMANKDVAMKRSHSSHKGELIIMPSVGGDSGIGEADSIGPLWLWNTQTKLGKVFSSSTVFKLPVGSDRSPDVAWVTIMLGFREILKNENTGGNQAVASSAPIGVTGTISNQRTGNFRFLC